MKKSILLSLLIFSVVPCESGATGLFSLPNDQLVSYLSFICTMKNEAKEEMRSVSENSSLQGYFGQKIKKIHIFLNRDMS